MITGFGVSGRSPDVHLVTRDGPSARLAEVPSAPHVGFFAVFDSPRRHLCACVGVVLFAGVVLGQAGGHFAP